MRLFRIRNRYLFKSNNPKGVHIYAVYYDRKNSRYNAVQLTHLYNKDRKRFASLNKKLLMKEKFSFSEVPSGVKNSYFYKNKSGGKINLKDKNNVFPVSGKHLSKKQSSRIKSFAVRPEN